MRDDRCIETHHTVQIWEERNDFGDLFTHTHTPPTYAKTDASASAAASTGSIALYREAYTAM